MDAFNLIAAFLLIGSIVWMGYLLIDYHKFKQSLQAHQRKNEEFLVLLENVELILKSDLDQDAATLYLYEQWIVTHLEDVPKSERGEMRNERP